MVEVDMSGTFAEDNGMVCGGTMKVAIEPFPGKETISPKNTEIGGVNMKISTRGRYALRLMLDLALNSPDQYVTIKSISERQDISNKYLEQIITALSRAGCKKYTGSTGRVQISASSGRIYCGHGFKAYRRQPGTRCLYGRYTEQMSQE